MCVLMKIKINFHREGVESGSGYLLPPISCIGIYHIWKGLHLHLGGHFSLGLGLWEFLYLNHL